LTNTWKSNFFNIAQELAKVIIKHSTHRAKREFILKESEIEEFELKEKKKKGKVARNGK
jgi:hypothetical protein